MSNTVLNMETTKEIQNLKAFLNRTGKTMTWAAREMEVSYPHFHHVLNGRRKMSSSMKARINCLLSKVSIPVAG